MSWRDRAACIGSDRDFAKIGSGSHTPDFRFALAVCQTCPVLSECLEAALAMPPEGTAYAVWGGMTPRQLSAERTRRAGGPKPRPVTFPVGDPRHGTSTGYSTRDCRCRLCTEWAAEHSRRRRRARLAS